MTFRSRRVVGPLIDMGYFNRFDPADPDSRDITIAGFIPQYDHGITDVNNGRSDNYIDPSPMNINKFTVTSAKGVNLHVPGNENVLDIEYVNYFPHFIADLSDAQHLLPHPLDLVTYNIGGPWATNLLRKTNPSRPEVSLPAFAGELKDLPDQIFEKGKKTLTKNDSLGIRFGILPLIGDVLRMINISESVDKRSQELMRFSKNGGAKAYRVLKRDKAVSVTKINNGGITGDLIVNTTQKVWGTCWWKPVDVRDTFIKDGNVNRAAVRRLLLGISERKDFVGYARDAWELVPFSWMADWFGNFGDYLEATAGSNLFVPSRICIMARSDTLRSFQGSGASITIEHVQKTRVPATPSLAVSVPILTPDQTLTLIGLTDRHRRSKFKPPKGGGSGGPIIVGGS